MKRFKIPFKMGTEKHEDIPQIAYKDLAPVFSCRQDIMNHVVEAGAKIGWRIS